MPNFAYPCLPLRYWTPHTYTQSLALSNTHTYTHSNMAWKSVMSSTSHHALFLCSEVSEANGNSSFSLSPPTPTFILSFLLSFSPHPPSLHRGAALICIEEEPPTPPPPPHLLSFLPFSFLFTFTASASLFLLSGSFHSRSLPSFKSCTPYFLHISNFKRAISFFHRVRIRECCSMVTSSLPLFAALSLLP